MFGGSSVKIKTVRGLFVFCRCPSRKRRTRLWLNHSWCVTNAARSNFLPLVFFIVRAPSGWRSGVSHARFCSALSRGQPRGRARAHTYVRAPARTKGQSLIIHSSLWWFWVARVWCFPLVFVRESHLSLLPPSPGDGAKVSTISAFIRAEHPVLMFSRWGHHHHHHHQALAISHLVWCCSAHPGFYFYQR